MTDISPGALAPKSFLKPRNTAAFCGTVRGVAARDQSGKPATLSELFDDRCANLPGCARHGSVQALARVDENDAAPLRVSSIHRSF
jgi:hypothetical protein